MSAFNWYVELSYFKPGNMSFMYENGFSAAVHGESCNSYDDEEYIQGYEDGQLCNRSFPRSIVIIFKRKDVCTL